MDDRTPIDIEIGINGSSTIVNIKSYVIIYMIHVNCILTILFI